jgi:hypothetical protein
MILKKQINKELQRLDAQRQGKENWRLWGPYLAERAWGTVREDYSPYGTAWEYFDHDQARSRAYRWNEDGMGGICDEKQRLCFALSLWNGVDPILKERAFGLTGNQGNHGEDVKELYFYPDAVPSHSYMRYLYKYPQREYPYRLLVEENARRSRSDPPFNLLDTGVFGENRYWDMEVDYAKASPDEIHIRITVSNRGPESAVLHILPTLWFRNTWSWGKTADPKPVIKDWNISKGVSWSVETDHPTLCRYYLYGRQEARLLYTENESNFQRLWNQPNPTPYRKDAFHRCVVNGDKDAVNPDQKGTKFAAWYTYTVASGRQEVIEMVLSARPMQSPFNKTAAIFSIRDSEAKEFYNDLLPGAGKDDRLIIQHAFAGMIWSKQFYNYDLSRWLDGDLFPPPEERRYGRNHTWWHFKAEDIISMPDKWEYPWFAAWDLSFHCTAIALIDIDFAKEQIELLLRDTYMHPDGQIPAYEWAFGDVNPPVHAFGALKVFRAERVQRGKGDLDFLERVVKKLLPNYMWWLNRKDSEGHNIFEGGFMGLDNISVYDRSKPLPSGYSLKQSDSTGWMAMFALNMTAIALELKAEGRNYEDIAILCYKHFLAIANTIAGHTKTGISLWDTKDGFFKDMVIGQDGRYQLIDVFSWVGIIPLFACEIIDERLLSNAPGFKALLDSHAGGLFDGHQICACPATVNERGEHLLSLVDHIMLPYILKRLLNKDEFLSPYGIRSVSRIHAKYSNIGAIPGVGKAFIEYVPGESNSGLFGGNSNWRGPVWMPTNYLLVQTIEKFYRYLGDNYKVKVPCLDNRELTLNEISILISERLSNIFRRNKYGQIPAFSQDSQFQYDPYWKDLRLFNEYFHGETGLGLGAAHQTGWTGLVANLISRHYRKDIPGFWQRFWGQIKYMV